DIGKALTHEVEGSHAIIGGEIARKYGESAKIVNAIAAHHEEVRAETILAPLVDAADALSGARPGARREVLESYVKRLEDLERISNSFRGGREILRRSGGPRDPHHRRPGNRAGRSGGPAGARRGAQDRTGNDLPRADQGDRHPGDARERPGALTDAAPLPRRRRRPSRPASPRCPPPAPRGARGGAVRGRQRRECVGRQGYR